MEKSGKKSTYCRRFAFFLRFTAVQSNFRYGHVSVARARCVLRLPAYAIHKECFAVCVSVQRAVKLSSKDSDADFFRASFL